MIRIRLRENGPIIIESDSESDELTIVDWEGQPYTIARRPVALCRCGQSGNKPFCDGSHRHCGFDGGPRATPRSGPDAG